MANELNISPQSMMKQTTALKVPTGEIRQRNNTPTGQTPPENAQPFTNDPFNPEAASLTVARTVAIVISLLGVLCFAILAIMFNARYPFFAFRGNMEEAAASCKQTAILFFVVALIAIAPPLANFFSMQQKAKSLQKKHVLPGAYRR